MTEVTAFSPESVVQRLTIISFAMLGSVAMFAAAIILMEAVGPGVPAPELVAFPMFVVVSLALITAQFFGAPLVGRIVRQRGGGGLGSYQASKIVASACREGFGLAALTLALFGGEVFWPLVFVISTGVSFFVDWPTLEEARAVERAELRRGDHKRIDGE